jgi:hypothetical protein
MLARNISKRFFNMIISHKSPDKKQRFNAVRDARLKAGLEWNGHRFQTDERSQQLIASRALKIVKCRLLDEPVDGPVWITADNSEYTFGVEEFLDFAEAVDAHVEALIMETHLAKHG